MRHEQHFLKETEPFVSVLDGLVDGRTVIELGCGTGVLTKVLLDAGARRIVGYEIEPALCAVQDSRFDLRTQDYTTVDFCDVAADNACLVASPAYSTLDAIIAKVLPFVQDVVLMIPSSLLEEFCRLGFRAGFELSGNAFDPPAEGQHCVVLRGFAPRFVDLHSLIGLVESLSIPERVQDLAAVLPQAAICAVGGIPVELVNQKLHWCGQRITASLLSKYITRTVGLSATLTYTNKRQRSLDFLGSLCIQRGETWAYHWFMVTMVLANQPPEVQIAFARDGRFRLGWTIEEKYTGSVFMASASLHDWIKFTAKSSDPTFDKATRAAMLKCFNILRDILP